MEKTFYPELSETVFRHTLPNGLPIILVHRPGFTRKLVYFVADMGSIHTEFTVDGKPYTVPDGIAHYLEHKLFDMPDGEVSEKFARLGANVNAFTGYDMTAYYFMCTDRFDQSLRLLLEFVSTPYFTEQSVQKEQGIIGQEIDMNLDNPDTQSFERLVSAAFRNHPVTHPILGTRQSIGEITPEILALTHRAFYRPDNMLLCVVGDVSMDEICSIAQEILPAQPEEKVTSVRAWQEEMTCPEALTTCQMEVAMPNFLLGFKCEPLERGAEAIRREFIGDLAAEALFGESSGLYLKMYDEGLIDSGFGGGFDTVEGMAILTAGGDSDYPEQVRDAILEQAGNLLKEGISEADFLRMKRSAMGRRLRDLDSFDSTCFRMCAYHFSGFDYFQFPSIYQQIQVDEVLEFLDRVIQPQRCSLSVIYPKEANHV